MSYEFQNLKNTRLWEVFEKKTKDKPEQQGMVKKLVQRASDRLSQVQDTFPTYTLHNYTHALNVVNLMGDLLGSSAVDAPADKSGDSCFTDT